jgi:hypothetical protein
MPPLLLLEVSPLLVVVDVVVLVVEPWLVEVAVVLPPVVGPDAPAPAVPPLFPGSLEEHANGVETRAAVTPIRALRSMGSPLRE